MGNACSQGPCQSRSSVAGMPQSRREPVRKSAASRMTHSTAITDDTTLVAQSANRRTSIVKGALSHDNPPRYHTRQQRLGKQADTTSWSKRGGMLFDADEVEIFFSGSTRLCTQVDANDGQVEMKEFESTKVRNEEPFPDPESLASGTGPWSTLQRRSA